MEAENATTPATVDDETNETALYPQIQDIEDRNDNLNVNTENSTRRGSSPDPSTVSASSGFNFWDVNSYKRTVKRIDDGARLCDDFLKLLAERAEIEGLYAAKLQGN